MSEWFKRLTCGMIGLSIGAAGQFFWCHSDRFPELSQLSRPPSRELRRNASARPVLPLRPAEPRRQL